MNKKAFTLAEILIVISIIGFIAACTVPSLLRGVIDKQWKSSYKKAFNAVYNLYTSERAAGSVPFSADANSVFVMFSALNSHLSIKDYAVSSSEEEILSEPLYENNEYYTKISFASQGNSDNALVYDINSQISPWIITEDNMAYCVTVGDECESVEAIKSSENSEIAGSKSCVVIVVDVNGLNNGPNRVEPQILNNSLTSTKAMNILTGDRFYIYVGLNGITAGNKKSSVMGRILSDLN